MDDNDITQNLRRGDITALELAYRKYADKLYSFALAVAQNASTAEDAVADVFITLYTFLSGGAEIHNLKAFLYTAVRNAVYDSIKRSSRFAPLPEDDTLIDNVPDVGDRILMEDALRRLPSDERDIVLLHCYEGFLHREIAGILKMPEGTVRWKYRSALSKLRSILGGVFDDR